MHELLVGIMENPIAVTTAAVVLGVVLGGKINKVAKFILPTDFMTYLLLAAVMADLLLDVLPVGKIWYAPFLLGYAVGYTVVGRTLYTMVLHIDTGAKRLSMKPWVFYETEEGLNLQIQRNRELFKRLVFGIEHRVQSNQRIDDDWLSVVKYPVFNPFRRDVLIVESQKTACDIERHLGVGMKVYRTSIILAYGSMVSKAQLLMDDSYLEVMQKQNVELLAENHALKAAQGTKLMEMSLRIEQGAVQTTPANRMAKLVEDLMPEDESVRTRERVPGFKVQGDRTEVNGDADAEDAGQASA